MNAAALEDIVSLRCPVTGRPLRWNGAAFVEKESGRIYPEIDGIIHLVPEEERSADLGDLKHYDHHPFYYYDLHGDEFHSSVIEDDLKEFAKTIPTDAVICDVGCGGGRVSAYLKNQGFNRTIALDYSTRSLEIVRDQIAVPVVRVNNLSLPFETQSVDVIISTGVIHHTPDPIKALTENCRVLREGGWMYLKVYRYRSYYHGLHFFVGGFMRWLIRRGGISKVFVDKWLFGLYRFVSGVIKRGRTKNDSHLRALFYDYFLNPQTQFLRPDIISATLNKEEMNFTLSQSGRPTNLYLAKKRTEQTTACVG